MRLRAHLGAAALFLMFAAMMLWPLPRLIARAAANRTTTIVNAWTYDWDWHATVHRNVPPFRAELPDHQYGIAFFAFPMRAAGAPPLLAHNLLLLLGFAFTAYGAFVLLRVVTGSWWAGVGAGIVLAFGPWRFAHLGDTQWMWAGWLPLMLAAVIALARTPSWPRAFAVAATVFMNGVSGVHWLVFGSAAVVLSALVFLIRRPRALLLFLASLAIAALLLAWWVMPYRGAFTQSNDIERPLFPGFAATLLALVGLIGPTGRDVTRQLVLLAAVLWIVLGAMGALGAFPFVPLSPAPWVMVASTGLTLLAGIGTMKLTRKHRLVGVIIAIALLAELRVAPLQWELIDTNPRAVDRWLARERRGKVVEIPMRDRYEYLFRATAHHRKLVFDDDLARAFDARPIDLAVIETMKARGVNALVVHGDTLKTDTAATHYFLLRGFDAGLLRLAGRFDHGVEGDFVFTFEPGDLKPYFGPEPASQPFGWLDEPAADSEVRGPVRVKGWALAPDGLRRVRVYLNNRAKHFDAQLFARPDVAALFPWHDASRAGFTIDIPRDREGRTDVEVEITDARGRIARLPQRWFVWER